MNKKAAQFVIETLKTLLFSIFCVLVITHFIALPCMVDGSSMYPTLTDGDRGFSSIIGRTLDGIDRFDIVVIKTDEKLLVKRVIGLPGETVQYVDDHLYINGEEVTEDFLDSAYVNNEKVRQNRSLFTNNLSITLGEDEYYCLGDNRIVSRDSRYYGPFSSAQISSRGFLRYFPFLSFGSVH